MCDINIILKYISVREFPPDLLLTPVFTRSCEWTFIRQLWSLVSHRISALENCEPFFLLQMSTCFVSSSVLYVFYIFITGPLFNICCYNLPSSILSINTIYLSRVTLSHSRPTWFRKSRNRPGWSSMWILVREPFRGRTDC